MNPRTTKILLCLIVAILLILGGYFSGRSSNPSVDSNTTVSHKSTVSADEVFANKAKCAGYLEKLQQQAGNNSYSLEIDSVYKVFYSRALNTCLSEQYNLYPAHQGIAEGEILLINDVLTGGNVWTSETYTPELKYWDAQAALDKQAMQYQ